MTISDNLIETIQAAANVQKLELNDGRVLTNQELYPASSRMPLRGSVFSSLRAFSAYCRNTAPGVTGTSSNAYVHVVSPTLVKLVDPEHVNESSAIQDIYAIADAKGYITYEADGSYRSQEDTVIRLMIKFIDTENRQSLIKLISSLSDSEVTTSEDDGISQSVTVKKGVARKTKADVSPFWHLAPIRTFLDVQQPESLFLLRIRSHDSIGLYEADCNLWITDAVDKVIEYLKAQEIPYPVYG